MLKLFFNTFVLLAVSVYACTSWVIAPDSSETGTFIVHKNRDWGGGKEIDVRLYISEIEGGKYKVLAFSPYMLFNEKGLGIIDTDVPNTVDGPSNPTLNIGAVFNLVAHNCASVQEALETLEKLVKDGMKPKRDHYTICDGKETAVVELTSGHIAWRKIANGFSVHTNHYIFPEVAYLVKSTALDGRIKSGTRLLITQDFLARTRNEKGRLGLRDTLTLARFQDNEKYPDTCPFRNSTVCAADYIAPPENAGLLGTLLICPGPTRFAPAIPVPLAVTTIPAVLENGEFGKLAYRLKRERPDDDAIIPKFNELEQRFWEDYSANLKEAKSLLDSGDQQGFRQKLQSLLDRQVAQAFALMNELLKDAENHSAAAE